MRGESRRIRQRNEREALEAMKRDRAEKDAPIFNQFEERRRAFLEMRNKRSG